MKDCIILNNCCSYLTSAGRLYWLLCVISKSKSHQVVFNNFNTANILIICCSRKYPYHSHGGVFGLMFSPLPPVPLEIHAFVMFSCKYLAFWTPSPPLSSPPFPSGMFNNSLWGGNRYFLESLFAYLYIRACMLLFLSTGRKPCQQVLPFRVEREGVYCLFRTHDSSRQWRVGLNISVVACWFMYFKKAS